MRPKGTKVELEVRRRTAVALLQVGWPVAQVADHVKASLASVYRWRQAVSTQGEAALKAKRHPGGTPRLRAEQQAQLLAMLGQGARAHGFASELWTLRRIALLIERHFGLRYSLSGLWRLLRRLGLSPQKPRRQACQRDEAALARWRTHEWPRLKKSPAAAAHSSLHGSDRLPA